MVFSGITLLTLGRTLQPPDGHRDLERRARGHLRKQDLRRLEGVDRAARAVGQDRQRRNLKFIFS